MDLDAFQRDFDRSVRAALDVAKRSVGVRAEERELIKLVDLIRREPSHADQAQLALAAMVKKLCETPPPAGLLELLSYCVHALGLPKVVSAATEARKVAIAAVESGPSRRPWEHARRCEVVIAAAAADWDERDMYVSFSSPSGAEDAAASSDLPIPGALARLISIGAWTTQSSANSQNLEPIVPAEVVSSVAPGEQTIFFDPPPFRTLGREIAANPKFWHEHGALSEVDPEMALVIGDCGLGSDAAIVLDYRRNRNEPSVMRLAWSERGNH